MILVGGPPRELCHGAQAHLGATRCCSRSILLFVAMHTGSTGHLRPHTLLSVRGRPGGGIHPLRWWQEIRGYPLPQIRESRVHHPLLRVLRLQASPQHKTLEAAVRATSSTVFSIIDEKCTRTAISFVRSPTSNKFAVSSIFKNISSVSVSYLFSSSMCCSPFDVQMFSFGVTSRSLRVLCRFCSCAHFLSGHVLQPCASWLSLAMCVCVMVLHWSSLIPPIVAHFLIMLFLRPRTVFPSFVRVVAIACFRAHAFTTHACLVLVSSLPLLFLHTVDDLSQR